MQHDFYDQISYLIIDTSQNDMAQLALSYSQRLFLLLIALFLATRLKDGMQQSLSAYQS